jgi:hypothetical protein
MRHRRGRALRRRYGHAVDIASSAYGLSRHDLGNNEAYSIGISHNSNQSSPWLAITGTQSKWFKTFAGAKRWLAARGYDAHGRRA